jgi:hypothetical protein
MTDIKGILLVPEEGDPHGLLKLGPCGARPPMAFVWKPSYLRLPQPEGRWIAWSTTWPKPGEALVLAWDGEPVAEGMDRWRRMTDCWPSLRFEMKKVLSEVRALCAESPGKYGTLVLIDTDGQLCRRHR